jgi:hypothetical protein
MPSAKPETVSLADGSGDTASHDTYRQAVNCRAGLPALIATEPP